MNRKFSYVAVLLVLFGIACGSMNRATPKQWDDKAIEADVRGKIAEAEPRDAVVGLTVDVKNQVVTLSGHVKSEEERRKIGDAANSVHGVKTVINNITIEP